MVFQADSIIQDAKRNSNEAKDIVKDIISNLNKKKDSASNEEGTMEQKQGSVVKNSEPDKWAIFVSKIGWAIFAVIVLGFVFWYFKIKRQ